MQAATAVVACIAAAAAWKVLERSEPPTAGSPVQMRLLTQAQYLNSISDAFGSDLVRVAGVRFAPLNRSGGLMALGAATAVITPGALDPLESTARAIASKVVDPEHRRFLVSCEPEAIDRPDGDCAALFLSRVGRQLYRRALLPDELERAVEVAGESTLELRDFHAGIAGALTGFLVAPQFLYVQENLEPDPSKPGQWRLDGYSKAARLSLLLWNSGPDEALLGAAERGELHTRAGLERQVERLLASARFERGVRAFFSDMLNLEAFDNIAKDPIIYPAFTLKSAADAREQTLRIVVDHLVARRGDYRDLFTTRETFLTPELAMLYRVPVENSSDGWARHELAPGDVRAGLLTQVGFLAQYSHAGRSSPTLRGRGIRETLLCQQVPNPPPNVNFAIAEAHDTRTARERLRLHRTDPTCAGCHKLTDPIGLALEHFDGAGQYREFENGEAIDATGDLDGKPFENARGLGSTLRDNPALASCLVMRLYTYSVGRPADRSEAKWMKYLNDRFSQQGYRVPDLLRTIATSTAFYAVVPAAPVTPRFADANSVRSHRAP